MSNDGFNPYSLRNMRSKSKKEADCGYTATLVRGDKPVAYINCGTQPDNDDLEIAFFSLGEEELFKRHTRSVIEQGKLSEDMGADEAFLREMAEAVYQAGRLAYFAKGATLYRLSTDPRGTWRQAKAPYRPALGVALQARHPGQHLDFIHIGGR